jgi:hypothetical protein
VEQVEFRVAASAIELEIPLSITVGEIFAALKYGRVGDEKSIADAANEGESLFEPTSVEVVEKDASHSPGLVSMGQMKILVAGLLEFTVECIAKRGTGSASGFVPVHDILFIAVIGGQIEAAAKPPDGLRVLALGGWGGDEEAVVGVACGRMGVQWVDDERDGDGFVRASDEIGSPLGRRWRHAVACGVGEIDCGLLAHRAFFQDPGPRDAASLPGDFISPKLGVGIDFFQGTTDSLLEIHQIIPNPLYLSHS